MADTTVLSVKDLTKSFAGKTVVKDVSFSIQKGDIYGFLGPNGAGKTTTIRMILGLIHKTRGKVIINGFDMDENFKQGINNVGAVVETPKFYLNMTAVQNLKVIANLHSHISAARIDEVLEIAGLSESKHKKVKAFSLGMKQRLGIAMALLNEPTIVFLDEPTNGIDPQGVIETRSLISKLAHEQGITFFITTHLLYEVEQICNKVAILRNGELITEGYVKEMLNTDSDIVEIHTAASDDLLSFIKDIEYVISAEATSFGIKAAITPNHSGKLNKKLNDNGYMVHYLVPKKKSLEELFIDFTEGDV
ncbi:ABC transporter ATP-binding protein [Bacillus marinisedimentorum]|uniref:ABC transporter ATP-binding protein n=1 Tax=Bacillus marinisedimentorum TaxID=1821260 RepID=UPI0008732B32|nr:ABC transporter ATP-binding protein [Bacillus marinisedimentorum]